MELRGVPGQLHFKFVRDTMRMNTDGVLMVVDSSDYAMIGDASAILAETIASFGNIPMEVIANKQDRNDAASPQEVASWLGIESATGTCAKDHESAKDALIRLLKKLEAAQGADEGVSTAAEALWATNR
ncbi:MAG: ADP-ribosylation factor-like protein [Candidatus Thorarchaeota archaeon]